ncbi:hypothetical protein V6Z11_D10G160000 [Gossypium hirsutum]
MDSVSRLIDPSKMSAMSLPKSLSPCPPPFFSQFENQPSPPPIHLHRSTSGPPRLHPIPESEVRAVLLHLLPLNVNDLVLRQIFEFNGNRSVRNENGLGQKKIP